MTTKGITKKVTLNARVRMLTPEVNGQPVLELVRQNKKTGKVTVVGLMNNDGLSNVLTLRFDLKSKGGTEEYLGAVTSN